ncbi:MAG TPA: phage protease [Opitutales bacterium]|nr:phage protease [Opitutales bacterium]
MDTIRIVEYGDFPHPKGLQRVNAAVARALVEHFHSLRGLLARRFGGIPVYTGHPDDPEFSGQPGHTDTRAQGWITELFALPDGLYGEIRWSKSGRELVENASYKFLSPRWAMRDAGNGVFEPVRLISVGLTNTPNIPGDVIANDGAGHAPKGNVFIGPDLGTKAARDELETIAANAPYVRPCIRTLGIGSRREPLCRRQGIVDAVNARMSDTGEDFSTAWSVLKRTRSDLF